MRTKIELAEEILIHNAGRMLRTRIKLEEDHGVESSDCSTEAAVVKSVADIVDNMYLESSERNWLVHI